jgi:hypothetical protein
MSFFGGAFDLGSTKNQIKDDLTVPTQTMSAEERAYADDQQKQYDQLKALGPQVMAQYGLITDASGQVRAITDQEAQKLLPPDQYAMFQARNQEAQALAKGTMPAYMKAELDKQNNSTLNAANQRLGPGGYYTSTPGNTALNQVQQNTAETVAKNRSNQLGLISSMYGLNSNIANALPSYNNGLLTASQGILKNTLYPFHEWANAAQIGQAQARSGPAAAGITQMGQGMKAAGSGGM